MGIITFAPPNSAASRPETSRVARAVVAGISASGSASLVSATQKRVSCKPPAGSSRKGVAWWGRNGPMPTMWGRNSCKKAMSLARVRAV